MDAIGIKEAAKRGADFLRSIYESADDILVEEVELDEKQQAWLITFSYLYNRKQPENTTGNVLAALSTLYPSRERNYKTLKIDVKTGAVLSMKIRELQG